MLSARALLEVWDLKLLILFLVFTVGSKETAPEQASINTRLVEDDRIFLVVPSIASYSYNRIATCR